MNAPSIRCGLLLLAAIVAGWFALRPLEGTPSLETTRGEPPGAQTGAFQVERALTDLAVLTRQPRFPGTPGHAAALEHVASELESLGLEVERTEALSVHPGPGGASVGRARNVVARLRGSDTSGAVLLAGHLDTVHTTTAASDCGGCAATVLESARALVEGPSVRNDVIFLIEDGEETSRAGSLAFVERHPWAQDVRVAVNLEAMGSKGASLLYVTGPQNGWLIDEALPNMPRPVAYSFVDDLVWGTGTGGSDLDQLLEVAEVGLGLVYLGNVPVYHTQRDNLETLDPDSLQHQGATMLALARHFADQPLDRELQRESLVYFNLVEHFVLRYSRGTGRILAWLAAALALLALGLGLRRGVLHGRAVLAGAVALPVLVFVATILPGLLWLAIRVLDPRLQVFLIGVSYDRPWYTLAFVLLAAGLTWAGFAWLGARRSAAAIAAGAMPWWGALGLWSAYQLPGSSYLFALPLMLTALWLLAARRAPTDEPHPLRFITAVAILAGSVLIVAPVIHFLGIFSGRAEVLMGLPLIAMLPAPLTAMLLPLLLPLFEEVGGLGRGKAAWGLSGAAVLILVGVAATAGFDADRPKPNMVLYQLDADSGAAHWVTGAASVMGRRASLLDDWTEQFFVDGAEETLYSPWGAQAPDNVAAYRSPAPHLALPAPEARLSTDEIVAQGRRVSIALRSPRAASVLIARLESVSEIIGASVGGIELPYYSPATPRDALGLGMYALGDEPIVLELLLRGGQARDLRILLEDHTHALPDTEGLSIEPRPEWMIPSPTFVSDATIVRATYTFSLPPTSASPNRAAILSLARRTTGAPSLPAGPASRLP